MAKRARRKMQPGRFRRGAGERSELQGSIVPGQRYNRLWPAVKMGKPSAGFMAEARQRVFNVRKDEKDQKYVARFKGTPAGVHELRVKHADMTEEDQWVDLYTSATVCVKMFWKPNGHAYLRKYEAVSMTYRTSLKFGNSERALRSFRDGHVTWSDPVPMILDD